MLLKLKKLSFALALAGALFSTVVVQAQPSGPVLELGNSGAMGHVPTKSRPLVTNKTTDLTAAPTELDDNRLFSALGCAALDTHEARLSVLRESDARLNDYFNTNTSNYMVTTLYNSPAVAQIFNGLENFAGARVRELQDRCAAVEYKDDLASAQWQAVQRCIDGVIKENFNDVHSEEVMADAFKYCLSSPNYNRTGVDASSAGTETLKDAMKSVLESEKWNGTLHGALKNTRLCVATNGPSGKDCSLMGFLPNVRWCTQTNSHSFAHCSEANADNPDTGAALSEYNISPEAITPVQFFDLVFGKTEGFTNYAMVFAKQMNDVLTFDRAMDIAIKAENAKGDHIKEYATPAQIMAGNTLGYGEDYGPAANGLPEYMEGAFHQYVNCSAELVEIDGTQYVKWEDYKELLSASGLLDTAFLNEPDFLPVVTAENMLGDSLGATMGTSETLSSDTTALPNNELATIEVLVSRATACAMADEVRLTLADYLALENGIGVASSDAALLGYRTQVAYAATRNVISFLLERLRMAQLDLGVYVSTDPNAPPPYVRNVLSTLIDKFEQKLKSLDMRREQQRDYAKMIANFHNSER